MRQLPGVRHVQVHTVSANSSAIIVAIYIESCFKAIEAVYKLTGMSMVLMLLLKVQEKARSVLGLATIRHEISSVCCLLASNTVLVPGRQTGLSVHGGG